MCYYFDDIIKFEDFDSNYTLIDEKSHENILIYNISYNTLIGAKSLHIRLYKIDGFIIIYDGTRYLVLFGSEKRDAVYNRIRYLISLKSSITFVFFHNYPKIRVDSYDSLSIEKKLTWIML